MARGLAPQIAARPRTRCGLRSLSVADREQLAALYSASYRAAFAGLGELLPDAELLHRRGLALADAMRHDHSALGWFSAEGELEGFARLRARRDGVAELVQLYVHPRAWGSGVAAELLEASREQLHSARELELWVWSENARARRFYERSGLRPSGEQRSSLLGGRVIKYLRYSGALGMKRS